MTASEMLAIEENVCPVRFLTLLFVVYCAVFFDINNCVRLKEAAVAQ